MKKNAYKNAIKYLPMFIDSKVQFDSSGAGIFEPLRKIIEFDEAYVFFLSPDTVRLKYFFCRESQMSVNDKFHVDNDTKSELFSLSSFICDGENPFIKLLPVEQNNSFLISKLIIKNTTYGLILMCKKEPNFYTQEDLEIATTIGSIVSYNIKDIELSNIFKFQLTALKDSIVETKAAYKTIKDQNQQIIEADRIKNEFLANISHELRTPLNAIIGFSEILSNKLFGKLSAKQTEYVKEINVSGIHLMGMINEILDISKIESCAMKLHRTEFLVSSAINEVVNVVRPLADKKAISIETSVKDGNLFADFQKIKQILYNLLSNAIKFTPENGDIELTARFTKDQFIMEVHDTGIGIEKKHHNQIFMKFFQLENSYTKRESSTGLGLTITQELVRMHKGEITVKSEVDKGTTFTIHLPLLTPEDLAASSRRGRALK